MSYVFKRRYNNVTSRGSSTVRPSLNLVLKKMNKWNMGFTVRPSLSSFLGRTSIIVAELEGGQRSRLDWRMWNIMPPSPSGLFC